MRKNGTQEELKTTIATLFRGCSGGHNVQCLFFLYTLTTSFWEFSEQEISNPADSGTSLETTNSDEMVDNTATRSPISFQT